ncbi:Rieske (2Fe-2S) protein [Rhodopirellula europaea]|uniref:Protein containing Rieske [2Fe-2S] iron-sulfur domain protein n=1 Tax=Rhodopirellula europaea 6C TaxID=1263867 RepID=M2ASR2_9BACT|nr:Rieske 2Fe-2S domain-containing protein [Rhodopirellula europaea]EMB15762.1 protein containing Rieske [2Fe-2S] iron-sulfur domain protein [Rhodopirellula europaea 6C]|tara:strand:+ start:39874 stop:40182 length:309 start_codon:yes stop_codon:yes gene_type:complete
MAWFKVACVADVPPGTGQMVIADDELIALFNIDGTFYAIDDACPHQGAPLSEGLVKGCVTVCPWHGAEFDVTNGRLLGGPGGGNVRSYTVKIEDDNVLIEMV